MDTHTVPVIRRARVATSLVFGICGTAVASWAPMVPLAKERLGINEAGLGVLLLLMGAGAILTMPLMGAVIQKTGSRIVILFSATLGCLLLPLLTLVDTPLSLGTVLFLFGAAIGTLDVAMNAQAVLVEEKASRPIMSSFHGMFSVGGLIGPMAMGLLMTLQLSPTASACTIASVLLLLLWPGHNRFLVHTRAVKGGGFVFRFPRGVVLLLGLFCFIVFLAEGALLDWSALLLEAHRGFPVSMAGSGYAVFSVAMAAMRFTGDGLVKRFGPNVIVGWGSAICAAGFIIATALPWQASSLAGFLLIGIGAANIVPVLFSAAGRIDRNAAGMALAAVTTLGYTGQMAGPAIIGFIAHWTNLPAALGILALPLLLVGFGFRYCKNDSGKV